MFGTMRLCTYLGMYVCMYVWDNEIVYLSMYVWDNETLYLPRYVRGHEIVYLSRYVCMGQRESVDERKRERERGRKGES